MRVIPPKTPPVARLTVVELSDRELQLISRGLYYDHTGGNFDGTGDENYDLNNAFVDVTDALGITEEY